MGDKSTSWLDQLKQPKKKKGIPLAYLIIAAALGIIFMFAGNFFSTSDPSKEVFSEQADTADSEPAFSQKNSNPTTMSEYENMYETQLKEALDEVAGVSEATVIVNLDATEEKIVEKNRNSTDKYTYESPNEGGSRKIEEQSTDEQVVVIQNDKGQEPIVVSTKKPIVRGVVVVAVGAENMEVKKMIVDAVTRLLDVKSHRVMVLPKKLKGNHKMVLKKQTVWLLTMLSLIIVLSAYYIMTPGTDNMALVGDDDQSQEEAKKDEAKETTTDGDVVTSSVSSDEAFAALRLEIQEQRDAAIEDYTAVIASEASADLRNDAHEQRQELMALSQKESVLENVIKSEGYSDAVVYTLDNEKVRVIVKADQLSNEEANNIMVLAQEQLGDGHQIAVEFQPTAK